MDGGMGGTEGGREGGAQREIASSPGTGRSDTRHDTHTHAFSLRYCGIQALHDEGHAGSSVLAIQRNVLLVVAVRLAAQVPALNLVISPAAVAVEAVLLAVASERVEMFELLVIYAGLATLLQTLRWVLSPAAWLLLLPLRLQMAQ